MVLRHNCTVRVGVHRAHVGCRVLPEPKKPGVTFEDFDSFPSMRRTASSGRVVVGWVAVEAAP